MVNHVVPTLGRLQSVDIKTIWTSEPHSFDPWLTQPDNLQFLADALGLSPGLEVVQTQASVGPFAADVIAQIIGTDHKVVIENQLDKADHRHLGQVLTYAQHFDARICVWIAAQICDEHRAAVDWLNRVTNEGYAFFGVEVRAVKIGNSDPAPLFDVVAKPNAWSRVVTTSTATGDVVGVASGDNEEYWAAFQERLTNADLPIRQVTKPLRQGQYWIPVGLGSVAYLWAYRSQGKSQFIQAGMSLYGEDGAYSWSRLRESESEIQSLFNAPLNWLGNDKGTAFHIQFGRSAIKDSLQGWHDQHELLLGEIAALNNKLVPRLKDILAERRAQID
ncbi:hypothetical protein ACLB0R_10010 [Sphingomonas sp. GlSt437]|uniref:hypothetical protein n=1 Tax=Sphingomonas sp. GlSt437 TaxID=3389970 RepID=UPI003A8B4C85